MGESLNLGFREVFRIVIPGAYGLGWLYALLGERANWLLSSSAVSIGAAVVVGVGAYALLPHSLPLGPLNRWWPYARLRKKHIGELSDAIARVLEVGDEADHRSRDAFKNLYKYFVATGVREEVANRIHYTTSLVYMLEELSFISLLAAAGASFSGHFLLALAAGVAVVAFEFRALRELGDICREQALLCFHMRDELLAVKASFLKVVNGAPTVGGAGGSLDLKVEAERILADLILDPSTAVTDVEVRLVSTARFDSDTPRTLHLVTVHTTDASMVLGAVAAYKGSYKERLEGALTHLLRRQGSRDQVAVDVVGPWGDSITRLVPIGSMVGRGFLSEASPIVTAARAHGIPHILIRGRHLLGPSPAVMHAVEEEVETYQPNSVLELFAGTGIGSLACVSRRPEARIVAVESDPVHAEGLRRSLAPSATVVEADAFTWVPDRRYDLVIADPYYEAAIDFLVARGSELRKWAVRLLFVGGNIEHVSWNDSIERHLRDHGFEPRRYPAFGQVVFRCA